MSGFSSKSSIEFVFDTFGEVTPVFIGFYGHFWFFDNEKPKNSSKWSVQNGVKK